MTGKNPRPVRVLYRMEAGVHTRSSADAAILDGIVGLNLDGAEKTQARRQAVSPYLFPKTRPTCSPKPRIFSYLRMQRSMRKNIRNPKSSQGQSST